MTGRLHRVRGAHRLPGGLVLPALQAHDHQQRTGGVRLAASDVKDSVHAYDRDEAPLKHDHFPFPRHGREFVAHGLEAVELALGRRSAG